VLDIAPASTDADLELLISVRRRVDPDVHPQLANLLHFLATTSGGVYLLAQFIAAHLAGRTAEEALKLAVAAGAASTLQVGAGNFDPREAGRLLSSVEVVELSPVA